MRRTPACATALTCAADPGPALDAWLETLPDAEIVLRGHLVADLAIDRTESAIILDVLTLAAA